MIDCERLKKIIDEADYLAKHGAIPTAPAFQSWYNLTERFLLKKYGKDSIELANFRNTRFIPRRYSDNRQLLAKCSEGLLACKLTFQGYLEELKEEGSNGQDVEPVAKAKNFSKIFIVHGHDEALKQSVALLIEKQNIEAVILSEKANKGKTIIEKLEEHSDVGCAICLFTPDDTGKANKETDYKARARQNVVLEAGFFMGKLGREYVVYLASSQLEMPSDLQGVVYTNANNWQFDLLRELKEMGYTIDFNKLA